MWLSEDSSVTCLTVLREKPLSEQIQGEIQSLTTVGSLTFRNNPF